jgi:hypothetical protein
MTFLLAATLPPFAPGAAPGGSPTGVGADVALFLHGSERRIRPIRIGVLAVRREPPLCRFETSAVQSSYRFVEEVS